MPICISGYEDNKLVDVEGNSYIDFTSVYGVANTGWARKELIEIACYRYPMDKTKETCDVECTSFIETSLNTHPDIGIFFIELVYNHTKKKLKQKFYCFQSIKLCSFFRNFLSKKIEKSN